MTFRAYVCERIRTLDLLVRSQTLYPAELHTLTVDRGYHEVVGPCLHGEPRSTQSILMGEPPIIC